MTHPITKEELAEFIHRTEHKHSSPDTEPEVSFKDEPPDYQEYCLFIAAAILDKLFSGKVNCIQGKPVKEGWYWARFACERRFSGQPYYFQDLEGTPVIEWHIAISSPPDPTQQEKA